MDDIIRSEFKKKNDRIAELESIRDAEREVHIREIEAWERVHRAMIDERDAARERAAELEAALEGIITELNGDGYFWTMKDKAIQLAGDALAKVKK
jgi:DNA repair exonuclease SbcCD ATPase subunit